MALKYPIANIISEGSQGDKVSFSGKIAAVYDQETRKRKSDGQPFKSQQIKVEENGSNIYYEHFNDTPFLKSHVGAAFAVSNATYDPWTGADNKVRHRAKGGEITEPDLKGAATAETPQAPAAGAPHSYIDATLGVKRIAVELLDDLPAEMMQPVGALINTALIHFSRNGALDMSEVLTLGREERKRLLAAKEGAGTGAESEGKGPEEEKPPSEDEPEIPF